jgi:transcriptional regulator with XRE-family HTH domain
VTMTFADWLRGWRSVLSWSQDDLAGASGLQKPLISKLESSAPGYVPRIDTIVKLCAGLNTSVAEPLIALGLLDRDDLVTTPDEEGLVRTYRALDDRGRKNLLDFAHTLKKNHSTNRVKAPFLKATPALQRGKAKQAKKSK